MTPTLHRRVGRSLAAALTLIAILHAYWALGGRWGLAEGLGGADKPIPPSWLIWVVTGLFGAAALVVLARLGMWGQQLPNWLFRVGCWLLTLVLLFAALLNLAGDTEWERFGFGPLALLLAAAAAVVARGPRRVA